MSICLAGATVDAGNGFKVSSMLKDAELRAAKDFNSTDGTSLKSLQEAARSGQTVSRTQQPDTV
jgi:hypothetical protein